LHPWKHDLPKTTTEDGITIERQEPKYRQIAESPMCSRNDSRIRKFPLSLETEIDIPQLVKKAEPQTKAALGGISIEHNLDKENADSSIRSNRDPVSNVTDSSDLHQ
jgi:hypothetical protein